MMVPEGLKPFVAKAVRVVVGILCIGAGLWLRKIHETRETIVSGICSSPESSIECWIVDFSLNTLGIGQLSTWLFVAGFVIIILFDFIASIISRTFALAADRVADTTKLFIDLLKNNKISKKNKDNVLNAIFEYYTTAKDTHGRNFSQFLIDLFINVRLREGGFWRRGYNTNVRVRPLPQESALDQTKFLSWKELTIFSVVSPKGRGKYLHTSRSSIVAEETDIPAILKHWNYTVKQGPRDIFKFADFRNSITTRSVKKRNGYKNGPLHVYFENGQLFINYEKKLSITDEETQITVDESSIIPADDTAYIQGLLEPTEGFTFRFEVPEGYEIIRFSESPQAYHRSAGADVAVEVSAREASITTSKWVLPGIVTVVRWRKQNEGAEAATEIR